MGHFPLYSDDIPELYDWLVVDLPLWKKKYEFVSWDDEIPNVWKIKNIPNHQPDILNILDLDYYHIIDDITKDTWWLIRFILG